MSFGQSFVTHFEVLGNTLGCHCHLDPLCFLGLFVLRTATVTKLTVNHTVDNLHPMLFPLKISFISPACEKFSRGSSEVDWRIGFLFWRVLTIAGLWKQTQTPLSRHLPCAWH